MGLALSNSGRRDVLDARLGTWAEELQKARNLSAHASGEKVTKEDAQDLLDFVEAICEYVFVLTAKFESYIARRKKPNKHTQPPNPDLDEAG